MGEDIDCGMGDTPDYPVGHLSLGHPHPRVHCYDHQVEFIEVLVGEVEAPIGEDIDLHPPEDLDLRDPLPYLIDLLPLLLSPLRVETIGDPHRHPIAGDRHILVAPLGTCTCHLLDRGLPIAPPTMHMEVAPDIIEDDEVRQIILERRLDLAPILPQLGWDPDHPDRLEDILFPGATYLLTNVGRLVLTSSGPLDPEDTIFVDLQTALDP